MTRRRTVWPLLVALMLATRAQGAPCPGPAVVTIVGDNRSGAATVNLTVTGTRVASDSACDPGGRGLVTSYATTVPCTGTGTTICGRIDGLAPGVWVHQVAVQVPGSSLQLQAQRSIVLADGGVPASNVVEWTVFGKTFVVTQATRANLVAQLAAAANYTSSSPFPALVRFDRTAFPGAATPQTIAMQTAPACALDTCGDARESAHCFEGSRVTVDALDADAEPGGVVLTVGTCDNSLLRVYGSDVVLRGLVLLGSTDPAPSVAVDTIAIAGPATRRTRLEQCTIVGPTLGDAVSIQDGAGGFDGGAASEIAVVRSEVRGAEDKGIKVLSGGVGRVERSCVHDNLNGGIQVTLGGTATAIENVVQHNRGGPAENGLLVGVPADEVQPNVLTTRGNVVRFNGARGISVVNNATATLVDDVVADNYRVGLRIETALPDIAPEVTVRGSAFACNYAAGLCASETKPCRVDDECALGACDPASGPTAVKGGGVALAECGDPGCLAPDVDLGLGGLATGRNAFTLNANPGASAPSGINVSSAIVAASDVPVAGNQWEHCDTPEVDPVNPNKCNMTQVASLDVRVAAGTTALDLGTPTGPRHGPNPVVTGITPPRPRAGELVRVYGGLFNAIDGAACHPAGLPADRCDARNPAIVTRNAASVAQGNHVTVTMDGVAYAAEVHQVTPSMLVFAMPVDCQTPATLTVARGNDVAMPVTLCDPPGCAERPPGAICDDQDACTVGETCQPNGTCGGGTALTCAGQCLTGVCDATSGCLPRTASTPCSDGDACTVGDHCSGTDDTCVTSPATCFGACFTGACDSETGCIPRDATASCTDGSACTTGDHCSGVDDTCLGSPVDCDDHLECTNDGCNPVTGCMHQPRPDGTSCASTEACPGPAACIAGVCMQSAASCDDGHACSHDVCDPVTGCNHFPLSALAGVTCHVTQLDALVSHLASSTAAVEKVLRARVACADRRLVAAAAAGDGTRARVKQARRAARCLNRFSKRVKLVPGLTSAERGILADEGKAARVALEAYFGL